MIFSPASVLCIIGYAIASKIVLALMGAPMWGPEHLFAMLGIIPVGWRCGRLDSEGR